jgi:predicted metal-binding membrane protein
VSQARDGSTDSPGTAAHATTWWHRESVLPLLVLLLVTAIAWVYVLRAPMDAHAMPGMRMPLSLFLFGWTAMMVAMMLPATLPLILLYHRAARRQSPGNADIRVGILIAGYFTVWVIAGLPVYAYSELVTSPHVSVLPAALLIAGGLYQFTALKHGCHRRCSSPLFFLTRQWRPGLVGAARLGVLHGIDCLGCCLGLMAGLVALGMMNAAWMLAAAVIIVAEKTLPHGHIIARPLGIGMVVGGIAMLAF